MHITVCSLFLQQSETVIDILFAVASLQLWRLVKGQGEGRVLIESSAIYTGVTSMVSLDLSCAYTYRCTHKHTNQLPVSLHVGSRSFPSISVPSKVSL